MKTIFTILLLSFSTAFAQQFATVDGGGRILLYEDGTWSKVGEAKPTIEIPNCFPNLLSVNFVGDELHFLISDNGEEKTHIETIEIVSTKEEKIQGYVNGADKRSREPKTLTLVITTIRIGTELFTHKEIKESFSENLYKAEDKRYSGSLYIIEIKGKEKWECTSTNIIYTQTGKARDLHYGEYGSFTLDEAKILSANLYQEIFTLRLQGGS